METVCGAGPCRKRCYLYILDALLVARRCQNGVSAEGELELSEIMYRNVSQRSLLLLCGQARPCTPRTHGTGAYACREMWRWGL